MKKQLKLKVLATALAVLATTGAAHARILDATGGSSEFIFSAWDADAGKGYTYDLQWGLTLDNFVGVETATATFPTGVVTATPNASGTFFDMALPGFGDFLSSIASPNVVWNLAAGDSFGRTRVLSTLTGMPSSLSGQTNQKIKDMGAKINEYVGDVNNFGTHVPEFGDISYDGYARTVAGDGTAYAGNVTWASKLGATCSFAGCDTTSVLGGQNDLFMFFQKSTSQLSSVGGLTALTHNGNNVFSKVYLGADGNYNLQIAAIDTVAAIPEPSEYALMLAGLGMLGFMARRRLNNRA